MRKRYILPPGKWPQNRTRLDTWKTAGSQFLCVESMAVELWGSLTSDRRGRGAAHSAFPSHPGRLGPPPARLPQSAHTHRQPLGSASSELTCAPPRAVHGGQAFPPSFGPRKAPARSLSRNLKSWFFKLRSAAGLYFPETTAAHAPLGLRSLRAGECWEMESSSRTWGGGKNAVNSYFAAGRNMVFGNCMAVLAP